ncbi:PAS domain S-box protein [bacterium]|nr:MAG: PAS domain S-box protein [bacterium]
MGRISLSLSHKVLLAFTIVFVPTLVLFYLSYISIEQYLKKHVIEDLVIIADEREAGIFIFLESNRRRIEDFASDIVIRGAIAASVKSGLPAPQSFAEYLIKNKLALDRHIYRISLFGTDGRVVASTHREKGSVVSGEEYFIRGRRGAVVTEKENGYLGKPELVVSAPVYSKDSKELIGVIAGFISMAEIEKILTGELSRELGAVTWNITKDRKTMEIYIVNGQGVMLTKPRFAGSSVAAQKIDTPPVRDCLMTRTEHSGFYANYMGVPVAGASMCIGALKWTLIVEAGKDEMLGPVADMGRNLIITFAVVLSLIIAFFIFVMKNTAVVLKRLSGAVSEIAAGNYDVSLPVKSGDEIGTLAVSVNAMAKAVKKRTEELKESDEKMQAILDNTSNVISLKDIMGRYLLVNHAFERLFNVKKESIYGRTDYDLFAREVAEVFHASDMAALVDGGPVETEETIIAGNAARTAISIKFPLLDANMTPYAVCGIVTDITEIKRSEEALKKSEASLANAQRIAHIGSWEWDIMDNTLSWSDEIYRIFGLNKGGFGADFDAFINSVHPDDRTYVRSAVKEALYNGKPYDIDHRILLQGGAVRIVHEYAEVTRDDNGTPLKMTGTVQDITDSVHAADDIIKLNRELEKRVAERTAELDAANKELLSFSYSVAHDLRAPLRIIDGFSHALFEDCKDELGLIGSEHLRRVREASQRMGNLIDALLTLSKVTRAEMRRDIIDLSALAKNVFDECAKAEPARRVEFNCEDGVIANGDAWLLRIVLVNLVGNAWKFTSKRKDAAIAFGSFEKDGEKVYFVRDNGAGFDMKYSDRLFGAFQRLHSVSEFPGTGIGLATVARIVWRHGGRVWAEGETGKGAAFYFTLSL